MNTEPIKVERVQRDVIERKILAAVSDEATVAILATQQDLQDIIAALAFYHHVGGAARHPRYERAMRCHSLFTDLLRLNHEAFGEPQNDLLENTTPAASPADRSSLDPLSRRKAEQRDGEKQHRTSGAESNTPTTAADSQESSPT